MKDHMNNTHSLIHSLELAQGVTATQEYCLETIHSRVSGVEVMMATGVRTCGAGRWAKILSERRGSGSQT